MLPVPALPLVGVTYVFLFGAVITIGRIEYEMPTAISLGLAVGLVLFGTSVGVVGELVGFGFLVSSGALGVAMLLGSLIMAAV